MENIIETLIEGSTGKTREGLDIVDICFSNKSIDRPIRGFIVYPKGSYPESNLIEWKEDGSFRYDGLEDKSDIVSITPPPTKIEKLIINNEYDDKYIDEIFANENYETRYLGEGQIGETFIIFKKIGKPMYSFMLVKINNEVAFYKLLFKMHLAIFTNKDMI